LVWSWLHGTEPVADDPAPSVAQQHDDQGIQLTAAATSPSHVTTTSS
jgi:hypothetical protein